MSFRVWITGTNYRTILFKSVGHLNVHVDNKLTTHICFHTFKLLTFTRIHTRTQRMFDKESISSVYFRRVFKIVNLI